MNDKITRESEAGNNAENARIDFRQAIIVALIGLVSVAMGHFVTLYIHNDKSKDASSPMLTVVQCSVAYKFKTCGTIAKRVVREYSDELTNFSTHQAYGSVGQYKVAIICLSPSYQTNEFELKVFSIAVAGPDLNKAHKIKVQLAVNFNAQVTDKKVSNRIQDCLNIF